jgi:hypothetical protein
MNQRLGRPNLLDGVILDHARNAGTTGLTLDEIQHTSTQRAVNYAAKRLTEQGKLVRRYEFRPTTTGSVVRAYRYWIAGVV